MTTMRQRLAAAEAELACLRARENPVVRGPEDVVRLIRKACEPEQETFVVVHLNARQRPLRTVVVALGSVAQVDVCPREVFREAIRSAAHSIVIAHNHPSGETEPSAADIELTRRLCEVGKIVGIPVLDHLIIAGSSSRSLAALGVIVS